MFKVTVSNDFKKLEREIVNRASRSIRQAGKLYAHQVITEAQRSMKHSSTPSRPGQPPRAITGFLKKSYKSSVSNKYIYIKNTADYSGFLEEGTDDMKARPAILPLIKPAFSGFYQILYKCFRIGVGL